jgi:hypothetical protein
VSKNFGSRILRTFKKHSIQRFLTKLLILPICDALDSVRADLLRVCPVDGRKSSSVREVCSFNGGESYRYLISASLSPGGERQSTRARAARAA